VCGVSFIVCVVLCGVLFCVTHVICVLCLIVVPLQSGKNPFAVQINNNNK
jgi:type IV secretory pathway component VirB8